MRERERERERGKDLVEHQVGIDLAREIKLD